MLIIGGGPAGAACARRLKQEGVRAIVLDRSAFPRYKPCAGWVTPRVLKQVGMDATSYPFGLTEFKSFEVSINGIKFRLPTQQYSIRRYEFDQWCLQMAEAEFHIHDVHEIRLEKGEYIIDEAFSAHYLVGAGGTHCPVYRTFFSQSSPRKQSALIVAQEEEFHYDVKDARCRLWFLENGLPGYAWYVPKKDGYVNIGVGGSMEQLKRGGDTLKNHWNLLVKKLEETDLVRGHEFKPAGHSYYLRQNLAEIRSGNAFLVGDALGLATLDMGEGIGPAIQSGNLAAESIVNETAYSVAPILRYSFPSLLGLRK